MKKGIVTVVGGSGFLGRYVVDELVKNGYLVKIICRDVDNAGHLKTLGPVGIVSIDRCDATVAKDIHQKIKGSDYLINLVGILYEDNYQNFHDFHVKIASNLAIAAKEEDIKAFVHVSALGIDKSSRTSQYAKTKLNAENHVRSYFPDTVIIRPSVMFGAEDNFFNKFAFMAKYLKLLPLIAAETKLQPIYVGDVAKAIVIALEKPALLGKTIELAGNKIFTLREIAQAVKKYTNSCALIVKIPKIFAYLMAILISPFSRAITIDQLKLLSYDNIIISSNKYLTAKDLGLKLQDVDNVVPIYLEKFSK